MRQPILGVLRIVPVLAVLPSVLVSAASDNWPQWRGPDMTAVVEDDPELPDTWSATDGVAWKTQIPGVGWSSPIVWGNRVFFTSVIAEEAYEAPKQGLYLPATGSDTPPDPPPGTHRWMVFCLDLDSGELLWQRTAHAGATPASIHPKNSFASATPVTDGERIYALFGNLGVFAYDLDGTLIWSRDVEARGVIPWT